MRVQKHLNVITKITTELKATQYIDDGILWQEHAKNKRVHETPGKTNYKGNSHYQGCIQYNGPSRKTYQRYK